jgi:hypothetical protein
MRFFGGNFRKRPKYPANQGYILFNPTSLRVSTEDYVGTYTTRILITSLYGQLGTLQITEVDYGSLGDPTGWYSGTLTYLGNGTYAWDITLQDAGNINAPNGYYSVAVTFSDGNAANSPITYVIGLDVVQVVVTPTPTMALSTNSLSFSRVKAGAVSGYTDITVSTTNGVALGTTTFSSITGPAAGILSATLQSPHVVRITCAEDNSLAAGTYNNNTIQIFDSAALNSPLTVNIDVAIASNSVQLYVDRSVFDASLSVGGSSFTNKTLQIKTTSPLTPVGFALDSKTYTGTDNGDWCDFTISSTGLITISQKAGVTTAGGSYCTAVFSASNGANTISVLMYVLVNGAVANPLILVSPSSVGLSCIVGSKAQSTTVNVSNASGTLAQLGTVTAQLLGSSGLTVNYSNGVINISDPITRDTISTITDTIRVTANGAGVQNSPVDIPVTLSVTAASIGRAGPRTASLPNGYTWDSVNGVPIGSIFNTLTSYRGADNRTMPSFNGTVYTVNNISDWNNVYNLLVAGTIVDGDVIELTAGISLLDCKLPARGGWTYGSGGFVQIRTTGHASLPTYQKDPGPSNQGASNRVNYATHGAYMAQMRTNTTNGSAFYAQTSCGGYWFTGIDMFANTSTDTGGVLNLRAHTNTNTSAQTSPSQCPSQIVFDRCTFRSAIAHKITVIADGRHIAFYHCDFMEARFDPTVSGTWENKAALIFNTPGNIEFIGNSMPARGIGVLVGGGLPSISMVVPRDVMIAWNKFYGRPGTQNENDVDDEYARLELKTGGRFFFGFNDVRHIYYRVDHKVHILLKATDQMKADGTTVGYTAAHVHDIIIWCNRFRNSGKSFLGITDKYNNSAVVGCERIEAAWNFNEFDNTYMPAKWGTTVSDNDVRFVEPHSASGDGVDTLDVYHNTQTGNTQSILNIDEGLNYFSPGWRNIRMVDNVIAGKAKYGPVFGSAAGTNSGAMNNVFGPGNWTFRRNYIFSPTTGFASWDTTLLSANYQNGYIPNTTYFVDAVNDNYTLLNTTPASASYPGGGGGTDGLDCGYDHAYLIAQVQGVGD